jgi:hypothetical protein
MSPVIQENDSRQAITFRFPGLLRVGPKKLRQFVVNLVKRRQGNIPAGSLCKLLQVFKGQKASHRLSGLDIGHKLTIVCHDDFVSYRLPQSRFHLAEITMRRVRGDPAEEIVLEKLQPLLIDCGKLNMAVCEVFKMLEATPPGFFIHRFGFCLLLEVVNKVEPSLKGRNEIRFIVLHLQVSLHPDVFSQPQDFFVMRVVFGQVETEKFILPFAVYVVFKINGFSTVGQVFFP